MYDAVSPNYDAWQHACQNQQSRLGQRLRLGGLLAYAGSYEENPADIDIIYFLLAYDYIRLSEVCLHVLFILFK
jgi:cytochrome c-type biogenesis protein CcmE